MSDRNYKDYNLDNFDDNKREGKHFKAENTSYFENDNFDDNELASVKSLPVADDKTTEQNQYGDDFYSSSDNFEPDDEEEFNPVISRQSYSRGTAVEQKKSNDKKNITIIVLSIALALVIFIFALIMFMGKDNDSDKKPTVAPTKASETVKNTETTQEATNAPTEAPTDAPTDPPTEAPTEAPTDPPTDPPTQTPTEPMTEDLVPDDIEGGSGPELIS